MRTRKAQRKAELPISKTDKLLCPTHRTLQRIRFITKRDGVDVAVLACNCARTRYLATDKISVEHASTFLGIQAFQAGKRLAYQETP